MASLETWTRADIARAADRIALVAQLTPRELQILRGIADGKTHMALARELFISPGTVKIRLNSAYQKLGARNAANAVKLAYELGMLTVGGRSGLVHLTDDQALRLSDLLREADQLLALAAAGATDERIAATAISQVLARWQSTPPPGSLGWGATPADLGAAVVGALRLCGRMPKTQDQQRGEDR